MRSLAPDNVSVGGVGDGARDSRFNATADAEETLRSSLSGKKFAVPGIDIAGQQVCAVGVGSRHDQRWYAEHIGCETRCNQFLDCFHGRYQNLAAQVSAFLGGRKLVLEVNACG